MSDTLIDRETPEWAEPDETEILRCQIARVGVAHLPCSEREGNGHGYRCERTDSHTEHQVGEHTIEHSLMGNGYACDAIEAMLRNRGEVRA